MSSTKADPNGVQTAMDEVNDKGEFIRTESTFRSWVKADGSTPYLPEKDRYHLYVSYACPWASRCLALRSLKGLEEVISVSVVSAVFQATNPNKDDHVGWVFKTAKEEDACVEDVINNCKTIRELYETHTPDGSVSSKFTVPVLYDKKTKSIVNNESSEIIEIFNSEFNDLAKNPSLDLFPSHLLKEMDAANEWVYPQINNGVYRAGFATSQGAYDKAVKDVFEGLDHAEQVLSQQKYIADAKVFTASDVRLFVTLVRFDEVYHGHFKCNKKRISDYPNIENYVREIYQMPGIEGTVNMTHIKNHYHMSHKTINPYGIVPVGPGVDYSLPHDRDRFD